MTVKVTAAQIIRINQHLDECVHAVTGPSELDGAVNAAFQTMFGQDLNETVAEKAVALLYGVAKAHAFFDGNKRTAWLTFTTFLNLNGLRFTEQISGYQDDMVVDLVEDRITKDDVIDWIHEQVRLGRAVEL
ncbi:MAG: type II toxin-antitoxin system death-on-curing family toxin [Corynebacterium nuruki]|nr:type II toxin-antitoxin system death-on-curing family toxin [Corynebacterium nuruki]